MGKVKDLPNITDRVWKIEEALARMDPDRSLD